MPNGIRWGSPMAITIKGLDKLQRILKEAERAAKELNGDLADLRFDPRNPSSIEEAISEAHLAVDNRLGSWYGNQLVDQMAEQAKAHFEEQILAKVEEYRLANPAPTTADAGSIADALQRIRDAISDLRRADYQTFDRHAEKLSRYLGSEMLAPIVGELTDGLNLDAWIDTAQRGSMVGSDKLDWPPSEEAQLGLVILLANRFAGDSSAALDFAHRFYYNGKKVTSNLQQMVSQVFVPFERDFSTYVERVTGTARQGAPVAETPKYPRRVFLVHGHDGEAKQSVARFVERLDFEVVVLSERPNRGRTIIEKFEEHADVGFAIVLLTPDDVGGTSADGLQSRARQNVLLELGYFVGKLGRERVVALKRGELEVPSDFTGVVYTPFDSGWEMALARELGAADYEIDWNKVMR